MVWCRWAGKGPQDGVTPPLMTFSLNSAFYVFNLVANFAYSRWDAIYPDVHAAIIAKETTFASLVGEADAYALNLFNNGQTADAVEYLTTFSKDIGDQLLLDWFTFFGEMFVKYRDGYITTASTQAPVCGCTTNNLPYQDQWYDRIVVDTGDRYLTPTASDAQITISRDVIQKHELRAFQ